MVTSTPTILYLTSFMKEISTPAGTSTPSVYLSRHEYFRGHPDTTSWSHTTEVFPRTKNVLGSDIQNPIINSIKRG